MKRPPRCVAHGNYRCTQCSIPSLRCQCAYEENGLHWDTCPGRARNVAPFHDKETVNKWIGYLESQVEETHNSALEPLRSEVIERAKEQFRRNGSWVSLKYAVQALEEAEKAEAAKGDPAVEAVASYLREYAPFLSAGKQHDEHVAEIIKAVDDARKAVS